MAYPVPIERALGRTVLHLTISLIPVPLLLLMRPTGRLVLVTVHLAVLVVAGIVLTVALRHAVDSTWFLWTKLSRPNRALAGAGALVALVTGYTALVTLASSAALRLNPSLQYLQLLSALDIAWVTAALFFGVRWMAGERWAAVAAVMLGTICVWSIWNYLRIVGFDDTGGWIVDRAALMRYVLPFDAVAAFLALAALWMGSRAGTGTPPGGG